MNGGIIPVRVRPLVGALCSVRILRLARNRRLLGYAKHACRMCKLLVLDYNPENHRLLRGIHKKNTNVYTETCMAHSHLHPV